MIIDTHAHINALEYENIEEVVASLKDYIVINNGVDEKTNNLVLEMAHRNNNFYAALGYHPENILDLTDQDLTLLETKIKDSKVVAIGEIGLDYHYCSSNKEAQKALFIKQLELAKKYDKPVIVHSREATLDTYEVLKNYPVKAVIHCFSSSAEMAAEFIKIGCLIGIGGTLTFKNNKKTVEVVKNIALDKILLETDSPYLAPEPVRGTKNMPTNLPYVIAKIAEIKGLDYETVKEKLNDNAYTFFNLKGE